MYKLNQMTREMKHQMEFPNRTTHTIKPLQCSSVTVAAYQVLLLRVDSVVEDKGDGQVGRQPGSHGGTGGLEPQGVTVTGWNAYGHVPGAYGQGFSLRYHVKMREYVDCELS